MSWLLVLRQRFEKLLKWPENFWHGWENSLERRDIWNCSPFHWWCCYCCSVAKLYPTLCNPMKCSMPGFPVPHHLIESVMPSDVWRPLCLLSSNFLSIRVFSNELAVRIRWPRYWSFSFLPMSIQSWFPLGLTGVDPIGVIWFIFYILRLCS